MHAEKENAPKLPGYPRIINLEVHRGSCPCRCLHCPVGIIPPRDRKHAFGVSDMAIECFNRIASEMENSPQCTIRLHAVGEPLNWKYIREALSTLRNRRVASWLFTCAVTDDFDLLEEACRSVDIIEVSVNSATRADYKNTKGLDAYEKVAGNIAGMRNLIERRGLRTRLIVSRVESHDPDADAGFVSFWKSNGSVDDAFVRSYHSYNGLLPEDGCKETKETRSCLVHWARMNIDVKGRAVLCFNELFGPSGSVTLIGDTAAASIKGIWQGSLLAKIRAASIDNAWDGDDQTSSMPCRSCHYKQGIDTKNQTSEYQIGRIKPDDKSV